MSFRTRLLAGLSLATFVLTSALSATEYTFQRLAGTAGGPACVDALGAAARFGYPTGVATDGAGNIYVADSGNHVIRRVSVAGEVTTFAGRSGEAGSVDGVRAAARFNKPIGLAFDSHGVLYVADSESATIRRVSPGGYVTTFAGTANAFGNADGSGAAARFQRPTWLAIDSNDNVFVSDTSAVTIRKITPLGEVTTFAGTAGQAGSANGTGGNARFLYPAGIAVGSGDILYVADSQAHTIRSITSGAVVSTLAGLAGSAGSASGTGDAARFNFPVGVTVNPDGNLLVTEWNNRLIRLVTVPGAVVTTYAGSSSPCGLSGLWSAASFCMPQGIDAQSDGTVYVTDSNELRKITPARYVSTLAGTRGEQDLVNDTPGNSRFYLLTGVATYGANVYVADTYTLRGINFALGAVATVAGNASGPGSQDGQGTAATFSGLGGMACDSAGNLFLADTMNHTIRKMDTSKNVTTYAGTAGQSGSTDATNTAARFLQPAYVAVDGSGNVYVSDTGNHTIRRIDAITKYVSTFAGSAGQVGSGDSTTGTSARFNTPRGIACDAAGNVYVADSYNHTIRKITTAGAVSTFAGSAGDRGSVDGVGDAARFDFPEGVAVDGTGTIYVTDGVARFSNQLGATVRAITTLRAVSTIGGSPEQAGTEEGTWGLSRFYSPKGIAATSTGILYLTDMYRVIVGKPRLAASATIDNAAGPLNVSRTLGATPAGAATWSWSVVRRPAQSTAALSSTSVAAPTFTPDVPDRFTFRLHAVNATGDAVSITDVSLTPPCPVLTFSPASLPSVVKNISWGAWLTAGNGTAPYRYELQIGTLPPGLSLGTDGLLYGRPTTVGTYSFDIVAEDSFGCRGDYSYQITVTSGPTGLVATGSGATSVAVSWNTAPGSPTYRLYRKSAGTGFTPLGSTNMTSWNDSPVATDAFYLYRVVAEEGANQSDPSNSDLATTMAFTDDPVVAGATPIRSVHITQLRTAVAAVRSLAGLPAASWTPSMTTVLRDHVVELRDALTAARSTLALSTLGWTDPVITPAITTVKASHVNELRAGVK